MWCYWKRENQNVINWTCFSSLLLRIIGKMFFIIYSKYLHRENPSSNSIINFIFDMRFTHSTWREWICFWHVLIQNSHLVFELSGINSVRKQSFESNVLFWYAIKNVVRTPNLIRYRIEIQKQNFDDILGRQNKNKRVFFIELPTKYRKSTILKFNCEF